MPRTYEARFENVLVAAVQDIISVLGPAGKVIQIKRIWLGSTDTAIPTAQMLRLNVKLSSATFSVGSGGAAAVFNKQDLGDAGASVSGRTNDTVQGTTTGAFTNIEAYGVHIYQGLDYTWPQDGRPTIGPTEGFVFELLSTVSGTVHMSGGIQVIEYAG